MEPDRQSYSTIMDLPDYDIEEIVPDEMTMPPAGTEAEIMVRVFKKFLGRKPNAAEFLEVRKKYMPCGAVAMLYLREIYLGAIASHPDNEILGQELYFYISPTE